MKRTRIENGNGRRTQLVLVPTAFYKGEEPFEATAWVNAPSDLVGTVVASAVRVGDLITIVEDPEHEYRVAQVCATLREQDICVPHRLATLKTLTRGD